MSIRDAKSALTKHLQLIAAAREAAAFRRGAEAMRERAANEFSCTCGRPDLCNELRAASRIRDLPLPKQEPRNA